MLALYMILPLSVIKLRKTIPVEERKARGLYVMRGGKAGLVFYAGAPIVIAIIALLVNGTDYLCMGLIAISTGPIAYIIFKRLYGGMAKNDPERYPVNKKTKLAMGDTIRIGVYLIIAGAFAFLGQFWLHWYEITWGEWEPSDYDMFSNSIPQVLEALKWGGLIAIVIGIVLALAGRKLERKENRLQN